MNTLSFTNNWNNKLSGQYYTTIRLASSKYQVQNKLNVCLRGKYLHQIEIIEVRILLLENLNNYITALDMGLSLYDGTMLLRRMYPTIDFKTQRLVMVLCKVIKNSHIIDQQISEGLTATDSSLSSIPTNSTITNQDQTQQLKSTYEQEKQTMRRQRLDKFNEVYRNRKNNG